MDSLSPQDYDTPEHQPQALQTGSTSLPSEAAAPTTPVASAPRPQAQFVHALCGRAFSTKNGVKKHHWGTRIADPNTKIGCWARFGKPPYVAWDDHPSCKLPPKKRVMKNSATAARHQEEALDRAPVALPPPPTIPSLPPHPPPNDFFPLPPPPHPGMAPAWSEFDFPGFPLYAQAPLPPPPPAATAPDWGSFDVGIPTFTQATLPPPQFPPSTGFAPEWTSFEAGPTLHQETLPEFSTPASTFSPPPLFGVPAPLGPMALPFGPGELVTDNFTDAGAFLPTDMPPVPPEGDIYLDFLAIPDDEEAGGEQVQEEEQEQQEDAARA